MKKLYRGLLVGVVASATIALSSATVSACGIDGVPSALIDGHRVALNLATITPRNYHSWTQFIANKPLRAGSVAHLTEDIKLLRATIPADFRAHPWRWTFGDGTVTTGWSVTHRYKRAGHYKVIVQTFVKDKEYPSGSWFQLDQIGVSVR